MELRAREAISREEKGKSRCRYTRSEERNGVEEE